MPGIDFNSFDYLSDSVVITDGCLEPPGPRILHVNRAFTRMTGYDADEVIGKTPRVLQGPKTNGLLDQLRTQLSSGEDIVLETVNYRKDGGELGLEWSVKPVLDQSGQITNLLSVQRDVTERMRVQSALFEHKDRLEATLDAIGEGILLTDRQGKVTYLNPTAASLTGSLPEPQQTLRAANSGFRQGDYLYALCVYLHLDQTIGLRLYMENALMAVHRLGWSQLASSRRLREMLGE